MTTSVDGVTQGVAELLCSGPWCGIVVRAGRIVADVVEFGDGATVLRWRGETRSTASYASIADAVKVHSHEGTEFRWFNRPSKAFDHGRVNAVQDMCENCPFASIGGLEGRSAPTVPGYVAEGGRDEWLRGYLTACVATYGADWQTCEFGWKAALTIGGAS